MNKIEEESVIEIRETEYIGIKVDTLGNVYGKRGNILKGRIDRCGYKQVCLSLRGKQITVLVHRLILKTFSPCKYMNELDVNHKNGNKLDNRLENLEWCTRSENIKHSYFNGLQDNVTNQYGNFKIVTQEDIKTIKELRSQGKTIKQISEIMGYSNKTIRKYLGR